MTVPRSTGRANLLISALLAALVVVAVVMWRVTASAAPELTCTVLDVGQGDCAVLTTKTGVTMVVDAGRAGPNWDSGQTVLLPYLRASGIGRVDALLLTHPDDDHIGGAVTTIERVPVGRLIVSGVHFASPYYANVMDAAKRRHVPVVAVRRGQSFQLSHAVRVDVLNPPPGDPAYYAHPENNASIVLRVSCDRTSLLLTGDAEEEAEADMLDNGVDVRADVLKLGHHGSRSSSSERFLDAVRPKAALISVGRTNVYGHPRPEVLARCEARGIRVFRTDRQGAIRVESDGREMRITTMRKEPGTGAVVGQ